MAIFTLHLLKQNVVFDLSEFEIYIGSDPFPPTPNARQHNVIAPGLGGRSEELIGNSRVGALAPSSFFSLHTLVGYDAGHSFV